MKTAILLAALVTVPTFAAEPSELIPAPHPLFWLGAAACDQVTIWVAMSDGKMKRLDAPAKDLKQYTDALQALPHDTVTFECPTKVST